MDDEQLCVYTVSVSLLHKAGAQENIGPMKDMVLNAFLRALRGNLAFTLSLSYFPTVEKILLSHQVYVRIAEEWFLLEQGGQVKP